LNLKILEAQRERLMDRAAVKYGIPAAGMRLQQLIQHIDPPHAAQLRKCGAELKSLINAIRELNTQNVSLLTHSIELITGSLNFLDNLRSPNPVYRQTGKVRSTDRQGRFLSGHV
jgi:flagellar biosynthesis/type III secretory pathway chaperone